MKGLIASLLIAGLCAASSAAVLAAQPDDDTTLKDALALLKLSAEEREAVKELAEKQEKETDAAVAHIKAAVREKYAGQTREALTNEHRTMLDGLLAAAKTLEGTTNRLDAQYRAALRSILYGGMDPEEAKQLAERALKTLPKTDEQLFERLVDTSPELEKRYADLKKSFAKARSEMSKKQKMPGIQDRDIQKAWREEREEQMDAAEARFRQEARALLDADQAQRFSKAVHLRKQWEAAVAAAKQAYGDQVKALLKSDNDRTDKRRRKL